MWEPTKIEIYAALRLWRYVQGSSCISGPHHWLPVQFYITCNFFTGYYEDGIYIDKLSSTCALYATKIFVIILSLNIQWNRGCWSFSEVLIRSNYLFVLGIRAHISDKNAAPVTMLECSWHTLWIKPWVGPARSDGEVHSTVISQVLIVIRLWLAHLRTFFLLRSDRVQGKIITGIDKHNLIDMRILSKHEN